MKDMNIFIDGACSGNPGQAAIGVVFKQNGKIIEEIAKPIGEATNNIAEYSALIYALQEALVRQVKEVKVFTDSELVFHQMTGTYKVKDQRLKFFYDQVQQLKRGFRRVELRHIPREENKEADKLATRAVSHLHRKQAKMAALTFSSMLSEKPGSQTSPDVMSGNVGTLL